MSIVLEYQNEEQPFYFCLQAHSNNPLKSTLMKFHSSRKLNYEIWVCLIVMRIESSYSFHLLTSSHYFQLLFSSFSFQLLRRTITMILSQKSSSRAPIYYMVFNANTSAQNTFTFNRWRQISYILHLHWIKLKTSSVVAPKELIQISHLARINPDLKQTICKRFARLMGSPIFKLQTI